MAAVNIDVNAWPQFIARWFFAGVWVTFGWYVASKYILPHVPF